MRRVLILAGIGIASYTAYRVYEEGASRSMHHMVGKPLVILVPRLGHRIEQATHDLPKASKRRIERSLSGLRDIAGANLNLMLLSSTTR